MIYSVMLVWFIAVFLGTLLFKKKGVKMKISVDDQELFTLSEAQKRVIMNDIPEEEFYDDMKRRITWVIFHKLEKCYQRLKQEWDPKLRDANVESIPLDPESYVELVFSHPEYMSRSKRDASEKSKTK